MGGCSSRQADSVLQSTTVTSTTTTRGSNQKIHLQSSLKYARKSSQTTETQIPLKSALINQPTSQSRRSTLTSTTPIINASEARPESTAHQSEDGTLIGNSSSRRASKQSHSFGDTSDSSLLAVSGNNLLQPQWGSNKTLSVKFDATANQSSANTLPSPANSSRRSSTVSPPASTPMQPSRRTSQATRNSFSIPRSPISHNDSQGNVVIDPHTSSPTLITIDTLSPKVMSATDILASMGWGRDSHTIAAAVTERLLTMEHEEALAYTSPGPIPATSTGNVVAAATAATASAAGGSGGADTSGTSLYPQQPPGLGSVRNSTASQYTNDGLDPTKIFVSPKASHQTLNTISTAPTNQVTAEDVIEEVKAAAGGATEGYSMEEFTASAAFGVSLEVDSYVFPTAVSYMSASSGSLNNAVAAAVAAATGSAATTTAANTAITTSNNPAGGPFSPGGGATYSINSPLPSNSSSRSIGHPAAGSNGSTTSSGGASGGSGAHSTVRRLSFDESFAEPRSQSLDTATPAPSRTSTLRRKSHAVGGEVIHAAAQRLANMFTPPPPLASLSSKQPQQQQQHGDSPHTSQQTSQALADFRLREESTGSGGGGSGGSSGAVDSGSGGLGGSSSSSTILNAAARRRSMNRQQTLSGGDNSSRRSSMLDPLQEEIPRFEKAIKRKMKPAVFKVGEYIIRKHEIGKEMYFLSRGKVEVVSGDGRTVYSVINGGAFFGELGVLFNVPRTASIRAVMDCYCMVLTRENLEEVLQKFPHIAEKFRSVAEQRMKEVKRKINYRRKMEVHNLMDVVDEQEEEDDDKELE